MRIGVRIRSQGLGLGIGMSIRVRVRVRVRVVEGAFSTAATLAMSTSSNAVSSAFEGKYSGAAQTHLSVPHAPQRAESADTADAVASGRG